MLLKILKKLEDKKNTLLERRELRLLVTQDAMTPSKADVQKMIAEIEKVPLENVVIDHVYQKYGQLVSLVIAKIYEKPPAKKEKVKKVKEEKPAEEKIPEKKEEKIEEKK